MEEKKVVILMSTYNGEKYLKEQLDSLVMQTYKNIDIFIRDDGSSDNTVEIIKDYKKNYNNIFLIKGNNIGFINSFFELLKKASDADYYAYCDQDDVWMLDKIKISVECMEKANKDKPVLFFSNSDYYDTNMNFIATANEKKIYNFRNSLVECVTQGMTMVINAKTRKCIIEHIPDNCLYHDWWTYMICSGFGEIVYYDKSLVKYRRHNKSVTVEGKNALQLFTFRIKKFLVGDSLKKIKKQWIDYKNSYYDELDDENKYLINLFTHKYSIWNALKKVFYPKRFRRKIIDDIFVRLLFIFGRL